MLAALSLAIGLGALGMGQLAPAVNPAFTDGPCPPGQGVTVVVESPTFSQVRCALQASDSALQATEQAGFAAEFVPGQLGMVCTIAGYPSPCNGAPANAYWSFWQFDAGQWVYATRGAGAHKVAVDDWVGWAFGAGLAPTLEPGSAGASDRQDNNNAAALEPSANSAAHLCDGSSPLGLLLGLSLVLVLLGLAAWVVWRRR